MPVESEFHAYGIGISLASVFHCISMQFQLRGSIPLNYYLSTSYRSVFFAFQRLPLFVFFSFYNEPLLGPAHRKACFTSTH